MDTTTWEESGIFNLLRRNVLFQDLSNEDLSKVFAPAYEEHFNSGSLIIQQGTLGQQLFVIKSGTAEIFKTNNDGREYDLALLQPGDSFGELAFASNAMHLESVRAREPVTVWILTGIALDTLNPETEIMAAMYKGFAFKVSNELRAANELVAANLEKERRELRFRGLIAALCLVGIIAIAIIGYNIGVDTCTWDEAQVNQTVTPTAPLIPPPPAPVLSQ